MVLIGDACEVGCLNTFTSLGFGGDPPAGRFCDTAVVAGLRGFSGGATGDGLGSILISDTAAGGLTGRS